MILPVLPGDPISAATFNAVAEAAFGAPPYGVINVAAGAFIARVLTDEEFTEHAPEGAAQYADESYWIAPAIVLNANDEDNRNAPNMGLLSFDVGGFAVTATNLAEKDPTGSNAAGGHLVPPGSWVTAFRTFDQHAPNRIPRFFFVRPVDVVLIKIETSGGAVPPFTYTARPLFAAAPYGPAKPAANSAETDYGTQWVHSARAFQVGDVVSASWDYLNQRFGFRSFRIKDTDTCT